MDNSTVTDVVLFSSGWESTLCACRARQRAKDPRRKVQLLFCDYGQSYVEQEFSAAVRITQALGLELCTTLFKDMPRHGRVVVGRNEAFFARARQLFPNADTIWFGCRAPSPLLDAYGDSNARFGFTTGARYGFKRVEMPALCMSKRIVKWRVTKFGGLPNAEELVFSSEGLTA